MELESDVTKLSKRYEPLFRWLEGGEDYEKINTVIITGGRYSQKSFATSVFAGVSANDYNHRILYTRYTLTSADDSIIPEFTEKLDLLNASHNFNIVKGRIEGLHNNSKIIFKGIKTSSGNQTASLKSLKDFSMFILDEAEEMDNYDDWDKIKKSIRALDVNNLSILMLNPTTKEHWIYEKFFEEAGVSEGFNGVKGRTMYIHASYLDIEREFIADDTWEEYEELRQSYEKYQSLNPEQKKLYPEKLRRQAKYYHHVIMGGWLDKAEGVVFSNWKEGDYKDVSEPIFGQDYGFQVDPTTLVKVSIDKYNKIIYVKECFYEVKLQTDDVIKYNKEYAKESLIIGDSAEPRLISELSDAGVNIQGAVKGQGSVSAGIAKMQNYNIVIDRNSVNLKREFNNYVWSSRKGATPVDKYNHGIDAIRYAVTYYFDDIIGDDQLTSNILW